MTKDFLSGKSRDLLEEGSPWKLVPLDCPVNDCRPTISIASLGNVVTDSGFDLLLIFFGRL